MNLFSNLSKTAQIMMKSAAAICLAFFVLGLLVIILIYPFEGILPYATGIALGCVHSIIKIILLEKSLSKTMDLDKKIASNIAFFHYIGRIVLTVAVFALVILFPGVFGLFGAIIGVVSLQFSAYVTNIILKRQESKQPMGDIDISG